VQLWAMANGRAHVLLLHTCTQVKARDEKARIQFQLESSGQENERMLAQINMLVAEKEDQAAAMDDMARKVEVQGEYVTTPTPDNLLFVRLVGKPRHLACRMPLRTRRVLTPHLAC
jgi:hypothetical protein